MHKPEPAWKSLPVPEVNSRWDQQNGHYGTTARVMAIVENYVIARFSGCIPFAPHLNEWHQRFKLKPLPHKQRAHTIGFREG